MKKIQLNKQNSGSGQKGFDLTIQKNVASQISKLLNDLDNESESSDSDTD